MMTKEQIIEFSAKLILFSVHLSTGFPSLRYRLAREVRKDWGEEDQPLDTWLYLMRKSAPISPHQLLDMYRRRRLLTHEDYQMVQSNLLEREMAKV